MGGERKGPLGRMGKKRRRIVRHEVEAQALWGEDEKNNLGGEKKTGVL